MQHKFGALDLIRAGLQDLDRARTLFDELHNDGIDDDRMRLLLATLEKACDPDIALSNLVDIIKVMQSQGKDFTNIIADENSFVRLITVLGVSDEMGKLMRFRPELVEAAANDACESHLYNHEQRRAHVLKSVGADPNDHTMPTASLPLAEAATALRKTYRKQLAAIMRKTPRRTIPSKSNRASAPNFPTLRTRRLKARSPSHAMKWTAADMCVSPSSAWANWAHRSSTMYPTWT